MIKLFSMAEEQDNLCVLEFAERVVECIRAGYVEGDEENKSDLLSLAEQVLQYAVCLEDMIPEGESFVACIKELVSLISADQEGGCVTKRGRPEVAIEEDQLAFLTEQGFKINDIAVMFGCSRRTIEPNSANHSYSLHLLPHNQHVYTQQLFLQTRAHTGCLALLPC